MNDISGELQMNITYKSSTDYLHSHYFYEYGVQRRGNPGLAFREEQEVQFDRKY